MEMQQKESPVTLNSLIAAQVLQEKNPSMEMSDLLKRSEMVFSYMREKSHPKTYITVTPKKNLVEKHIDGLGFQMTQVTKNNCKILLNPKDDDLRVKLILAYYSMNLMPAFLIEGCLSVFLKNEVITNDQYFDGKHVVMKPLLEVCQFYGDLFVNEHFTVLDLTGQKVLQKVGYFVEKGLLEFDDEKKTVRVKNKEKAFAFIDFFSNLIHPLIDTYLVTLAAIEQICGKNLVLKQKSFVKELHICIKHLY